MPVYRNDEESTAPGLRSDLQTVALIVQSCGAESLPNPTVCGELPALPFGLSIFKAFIIYVAKTAHNFISISLPISFCVQVFGKGMRSH